MSEPFILEALPPWSPPKVAVLGIGHAGIRALNAILQAPVRGINGIAMASDEGALTTSLAPVHLHVDTSRGPEHSVALHELLAATDLVFLTGSMGEPSPRAITPSIARLAQEMGCLTIAMVSTFSPGDSPQHMSRVEEGLHTLRPYVDALLPLSVQRVWQVTERLPAWHDTENTIDMAICQTVQGIADLVTQTGLVCLDLMDLRMLFRSSGWATMGSGGASGVAAAMVAAQQALASPWLDVSSFPQARSVLVNIPSGADLSLPAVHEAASAVYDRAHPEVWKIFGAVVDAPMQDYVRVTVVAAGLPTPTLCEETRPDGWLHQE